MCTAVLWFLKISRLILNKSRAGTTVYIGLVRNMCLEIRYLKLRDHFRHWKIGGRNSVRGGGEIVTIGNDSIHPFQIISQ
jgi:hypothetical protein